MDYISIYKCRYCGKTFKGGITGNEMIAFPPVEKALLHIEPDHYGVGDLIGIEKVGGAS